MEIRQLEYFAAVVKEGSFSAAAAACHVSQPSLSQGILKLEGELGVRLFSRGGRKASLTHAGQDLYPSAVAILQQAEEIESRFSRRGEMVEGAVTVGAIPTIAPFLLPGVVKRFHKSYPGITVTIREVVTSELVDEFVHGNIDVAVLSDVAESVLNRRSLIAESLFFEELRLLAPAGHPLAARRRLDLQEIPAGELVFLSEGHCLRDQALRYCENAVAAGTNIECAQLMTMCGLIQAGYGVGFIPLLALPKIVMDGMVAIPFRDPQPRRVVQLLKNHKPKTEPAVEVFEAFLRETVDEISR